MAESALAAGSSSLPATGQRRRVLFFTPLTSDNLDGSWHRDQGLLVTAARGLGHEAFLVCPRGARPVQDDRFLVASPADFADPAWWRRQEPWGVVFNTWGGTRFRPVWQAALSATPRILDRLDTDGIRSPRVDLSAYLFQYWSRLSDSRKKWKKLLAPCIPPVMAIFHRLFPWVIDRPMADAMASLPCVAAESPLAVERVSRFLRSFGHPGTNVRCIPHPVRIPLDPGVHRKARRIFSAGRWESHQKNLPLQLTTLGRVLTAHPEWSAAIAGSAPSDAATQIARWCGAAAGRVQLLGPVGHDDVLGWAAGSSIFLCSSRHESFGIAIAEALCCGCSVVGPAHIPSVRWFASDNSGTVATRCATEPLAQALEAEIEQWKGGRRQPAEIAAAWRARLSAQAIVPLMFELLGDLPPLESHSVRFGGDATH